MHKVSLLRHPYLYYKRKWLHHRCKYASMPQGRTIREIRGIKMIFDFSLGKIAKNMYFDSYEFEIVQLLKKYLKPGGVFIDIGANTGYFSGLALGLVTRTGEVHSFEPVPRYYNYICETAELNPDYNLYANNCALGDASGQTEFFVNRINVGGSSLLADCISEEEMGETISVEIKRLDDYLREKHTTPVSLIKIDTQGWELPVLEGMTGFLKAHPDNLPPIIVEVTPSAFDMLGRDVKDMESLMAGLGYETYCICGEHRTDLKKITRSDQDVLFMPAGCK